jgi:hypothetical protein
VKDCGCAEHWECALHAGIDQDAYSGRFRGGRAYQMGTPVLAWTTGLGEDAVRAIALGFDPSEAP